MLNNLVACQEGGVSNNAELQPTRGTNEKL